MEVVPIVAWLLNKRVNRFPYATPLCLASGDFNLNLSLVMYYLKETLKYSVRCCTNTSTVSVMLYNYILL